MCWKLQPLAAGSTGKQRPKNVPPIIQEMPAAGVTRFEKRPTNVATASAGIKAPNTLFKKLIKSLASKVKRKAMAREMSRALREKPLTSDSGIACGVEIPGQLILFHAHIPGHGTSPKWFSIT